MKPSISVIVPVHNIEAYLERCLNSILAQTLTNIEVILINNGSTDQSGRVCDLFVEKDQRVQVIHREKAGVSCARNVGVAAARGEYIGFVDGDDYIQNDMYEILYTISKETESDIAICKLGREIDGVITNHDIEENYLTIMDHEASMRELFKGTIYRFSLCNKLFKKTCFNHVRFPKGRIHEDLATTYKLFGNANKAVYKNHIGYIYVKRKKSILTTNYDERRLDAFLGWDEILSYMHKNYPKLSAEVNACFVYSCVDHAYYILNQVKDKADRRKYLNCIQTYLRKYYKRIHDESVLTLKYKLIMKLFKYHVNLLILLNYLKNNAKRVLRRT